MIVPLSLRQLVYKTVYRLHVQLLSTRRPCRLSNIDVTSSSAMAERPRDVGDFKGIGHFEAKF